MIYASHAHSFLVIYYTSTSLALMREREKISIDQLKYMCITRMFIRRKKASICFFGSFVDERKIWRNLKEEHCTLFIGSMFDQTSHKSQLIWSCLSFIKSISRPFQFIFDLYDDDDHMYSGRQIRTPICHGPNPFN